MAEAVGLVVPAVSGSTVAVIAHLPAIQGTPFVRGQGAALSRRGAVTGSTLTVRSPAPGDLSARVIHHGAVRGKLAIALDTGLIALGCCQVASASVRIATNGGVSTAHATFATFTRAVLA